MLRNIERLRERMAALGISLRPHLKTPKSIEIARLMMASPEGPATVSTLKEAEVFAAEGVRDLLYAVSIVPNKLDRAVVLRRQGIDLKLAVDNEEAAEAVAARARGEGIEIPCMIEIDSDGHRAGVHPTDGERLVAIGRILHDSGAGLAGVMAHAGSSYGLADPDAIVAMAEQERAAAVGSASLIRDAGLPCPAVSVGSTPTAHFARDLTGVTEVRAGVYVFFDLVMAGIGVCGIDDIAISVLASVVGHQRERGWILVDAGWMAMSRDRGTAGQAVDQGYGLVADVDGRPYPDLIVSQTNQEQGIVTVRPGSGAVLPELPVGTKLRILPNHACATAAQHDRYHALDADGAVRAEWRRFGGW
ncbi:alanine racemase [Lutibaculum baratangense]|uniref:Metal activated pyridoxal enzyme n=1 Tax=Lutibaculum baratangense AMV1 TaxID=631454 RepID=V4TBP8_9HYPH|nr:alanine racemase [Lutibaculum baratangense]ESR23813.1 Metal activated pyridoxal enzyme [Lutibaculum baratangense AMV1]